jgi:hypothetical protein
MKPSRPKAARPMPPQQRGDDNVVDADYEEVKDDDRKKSA